MMTFIIKKLNQNMILTALMFERNHDDRPPIANNIEIKDTLHGKEH